MPEDQTNNLLMIGGIYLLVVAVAFWGALIIWSYRDMRARSRDTLAQIFAALVVAALPVAGLLIYLMLRPRETLAEAYERSLEEEALLQEIEEKPACPGCNQRIQADWQVCPHCHTKLKKQCPTCKRMLELPWNLCPHCASPQAEYAFTPSNSGLPITDYAPSRATSDRDRDREQRRARRRAAAATESKTQTLEFVDGDDA